MGKNKEHKRSTLMRYTKEQLVEHCMCLEHNVEALTTNFEIQYDHCMQVINDMKLINKTFKNKLLSSDKEGNNE